MRSIPTPIVSTAVIIAVIFVVNAPEHKSKGIFPFVIFNILKGIFHSVDWNIYVSGVSVKRFSNKYLVKA